MPFELKILSVPFLSDNRLNAFGDYSRLEMRAYRDSLTREVVTRYFLCGEKNGIIEEELFGKDIPAALTSFFLQQATSKPVAEVAVIPLSSPLITCSPRS